MRPTKEDRFHKLMLAYLQEVKIRYSIDRQTDNAIARLIDQIEQQESESQLRE